MRGHFCNFCSKIYFIKLNFDLRNPVNADEVPDYYDHILFPIDLGTINERIKEGYYVHVWEKILFLIVSVSICILNSDRGIS